MGRTSCLAKDTELTFLPYWYKLPTSGPEGSNLMPPLVSLSFLVSVSPWQELDLE